MRQQHDIVERAQPRVDRRLVFEHVEPNSSSPPLSITRSEIDGSSRAVDRATPELRQLAGNDPAEGSGIAE